MIVDDNDMMRAILRGILRGDEYEMIGEARNGNIAIEMAEIKATRPETESVMITGNAGPDTVQESV